MCTLNEYLPILTGLLTPIIAILALIIANRQFKIQEYRVRFDLYEPRMKIYESIMKFLKKVRQKGDASQDDLYDLLNETIHAKFLFKGEMSDHIEAIFKRAAELQYVQTELSNHNLPEGDVRTKLAKQMTAHFKWLM
jgi:hypothetical protein